jgi:hypothetical protein
MTVIEMDFSFKYLGRNLDFGIRFGGAFLHMKNSIEIRCSKLKVNNIHPGLNGVLRHSVKLCTLPQDRSLRERGEKKCRTSLA